MKPRKENDAYLEAVRFQMLWRIPPRAIPDCLSEEKARLQPLAGRPAGKPVQAVYQWQATAPESVKTGLLHGILPRLLCTAAILWLWYRLQSVFFFTEYNNLRPATLSAFPLFVFAFWGVWRAYLGGTLALSPPVFHKRTLVCYHWLCACVSMICFLWTAYLIAAAMFQVVPLPGLPAFLADFSYWNWVQSSLLAGKGLLLCLLVYSVVKAFSTSKWYLPLVFHIVGGLLCLRLSEWAWRWTWRQEPLEWTGVLLMGLPYVFGILMALCCAGMISRQRKDFVPSTATC